MSGFFLFLAVVGLAISLWGSILMIIEAFKESTAWGCGMFLPIVPLIFIIKFWDRAKKGFFISLAGSIVMYLFFFAAGAAAPDNAIAETAEESAVEEEVKPLSLERETQLDPSIRFDDEPARTLETPRSQTPPPEAVEEQKPYFEQVYADNETMLYWTEDCKSRPATAYRMAKSVAKQQGFRPADCGQGEAKEEANPWFPARQ